MDCGTNPWGGFRLVLFDGYLITRQACLAIGENKMKHIKFYKGVPMKLSTPKGRVRTLGTSRPHLKDGHGCIS